MIISLALLRQELGVFFGGTQLLLVGWVSDSHECKWRILSVA